MKAIRLTAPIINVRKTKTTPIPTTINVDASARSSDMFVCIVIRVLVVRMKISTTYALKTQPKLTTKRAMFDINILNK